MHDPSRVFLETHQLDLDPDEGSIAEEISKFQCVEGKLLLNLWESFTSTHLTQFADDLATLVKNGQVGYLWYECCESFKDYPIF